MNKRSCGVLMHITSLSSPYGIGTLGDDAEKFAEWLEKAGQHYWQILPIGPTGYGDSPYQPLSCFAGNPLLIDLDELCAGDLLAKADCENADYGADPEFVDYEKIIATRDTLLRKAFARFVDDVGYTSFCLEEADWLEDYALFAALKRRFGGKAWTEWEADIKFRKPSAMSRYREELKDEIRFVKWCQYIFFRQWNRFHGVCRSKGISLIGDIPMYAASDSADVWANPRLFELDDKLVLKRVAGVPPDYFSKSGQLWGNPLYNWAEMGKTNYNWWVKRIMKSALMFDVVRIDHFRAFDTYYAIPYGCETAERGTWEQGPGMALWSEIKRRVTNVRIIAEDLGDKSDSLRKLLAETGFPGMRVLQYGFNVDRTDNDNLPHNYPRNSVCYTGTHDNAPLSQWYDEAESASKRMARGYLNKRCTERFYRAAVRGAYASPSMLVIIPLQDALGLRADSRMNVPGTASGNWTWRLQRHHLKLKTAAWLKSLAGNYLR